MQLGIMGGIGDWCMGKFYRLPNRADDLLWMYSERGVVNFVFHQILVDSPAMILDKAINGQGQKLRQVIGEPKRFQLFTEFDFGSRYGFGKPDGGLLFECSGCKSFIFLEAKVGCFAGAYQAPADDLLTKDQARNLTKPDLETRCNNNFFNTKINGQLELRWRFVNAYKSAVERGRCLVTEMVAQPPDIIMQTDRFYWRRRLNPQQNYKGHWRHVEMDTNTGLKPLWDLLRDVDLFLLLAVTADDERPNNYLQEVRLFNPQQQPLDDREVRLFWMPFREFAGSLEAVQ